MNIYCSQLGMIVEFYYCISMHEGLPCLSTPRCWANRMDIEGYLKARLKLKPNQVCDVYEIDAAANE